jgi:peptidyl-prolyl cis-trans isomerase C
MNTEFACETKPLSAQVNGVQLNASGEDLSADDLRQRAYSELLRQAAMEKGLLPSTDLPSGDGVMNEDASSAIERLLEQEVLVPEPSE